MTISSINSYPLPLPAIRPGVGGLPTGQSSGLTGGIPTGLGDTFSSSLAGGYPSPTSNQGQVLGSLPSSAQQSIQGYVQTRASNLANFISDHQQYIQNHSQEFQQKLAQYNQTTSQHVQEAVQHFKDVGQNGAGSYIQARRAQYENFVQAHQAQIQANPQAFQQMTQQYMAATRAHVQGLTSGQQAPLNLSA